MKISIFNSFNMDVKAKSHINYININSKRFFKRVKEFSVFFKLYLE